MDDLDVNQSTTSAGTASFTNTSFKFIKDGQKIKYKPNEIWGFLYKGQLFRCEGTTFYYVEENGKVILYVDGYAIYEQLKKDTKYATVYGKKIYSMSNDLNSTIYPMPFGVSEKHKPTLAQKVHYNDFKKRYPEHKVLYECIKDAKDIHTAQFCIEQYNERAKID